MNIKAIFLISLALMLGISCQQKAGEGKEFFYHPKKLFSLSWDSEEWKQSTMREEILRSSGASMNLPVHDLILLNRKNEDTRFSVATQLAPVYGDLRSKDIRDAFRHSILTYPGATELYANTLSINSELAYRVDYRVSASQLGYKNIKMFCSVLIVNKGYWHILNASSSIADNIQSNIDLWKQVHSLVESFKTE